MTPIRIALLTLLLSAPAAAAPRGPETRVITAKAVSIKAARKPAAPAIDEAEIRRTLLGQVEFDAERLHRFEEQTRAQPQPDPWSASTILLLTQVPTESATPALCEAAARVASEERSRLKGVAFEFVLAAPACADVADRLIAQLAPADGATAGDVREAVSTTASTWSPRVRAAHFETFRRIAFDRPDLAPLVRLELSRAVGTIAGKVPSEELVARLDDDFEAALANRHTAKARLVSVCIARASTGRLTSETPLRLSAMRRRIGGDETEALVALLARDLDGLAAWPFTRLPSPAPQLDWLDLLRS